MHLFEWEASHAFVSSMFNHRKANEEDYAGEIWWLIYHVLDKVLTCEGCFVPFSPLLTTITRTTIINHICPSLRNFHKKEYYYCRFSSLANGRQRNHSRFVRISKCIKHELHKSNKSNVTRLMGMTWYTTPLPRTVNVRSPFNSKLDSSLLFHKLHTSFVGPLRPTASLHQGANTSTILEAAAQC